MNEYLTYKNLADTFSKDFLEKKIDAEEKLEILRLNVIGILDLYDFSTIEENPILKGMYLIIQPIMNIIEAETWEGLLQQAEELLVKALPAND